jgi:arsenate reductase-like glutaredoxin family protein
MKRVVAAKGAKIVTYDLAKDRPTDEQLLAVLLGNSGNLRAPTFKVGTTLLVGFNSDAYDGLF